MTTARQLRAAGVFVPAHVPDHEQVESINFAKVGTVKPFEEMAAQLDQQGRQLTALADLVAPLVTRQLNRTEQAKKAGCSRTTLWRREQTSKLSLIANGSKQLRHRRAM